MIDFRAPDPGRNCYRVTGGVSESSCGNELFYTLMEGSRQVKPLQEDILQGAQNIYSSSLDKFLQGWRNASHKIFA